MGATAPLSVFVIGTRAQLIKVAPVVATCESRSQPTLLLMTGQHRETIQDLIEEFGLESGQVHAVASSERSTVLSLAGWFPRAYLGLTRELRKFKQGYAAVNVIVHGDTMSTVLGALAAKRCGLPVFHLESGLTSRRLFDPFPEELSRRLVFRMTDVALCPGGESAAHMASNYRCRVVDTKENTIVDSVMMATRVRQRDQRVSVEVSAPYFVASLHRFQNIFDSKRLRFLVGFISELARTYPVHFVLHPATRKRLEAEGLLSALEAVPGVNLSPRLGYRAFLSLASSAACVLTDGGSNQEELAVLGVPTIVMRRHTERLDGLGENAVMEGDVVQGVLNYCLAKEFESLRRPTRVRDQMGPSVIVADILLQ